MNLTPPLDKLKNLYLKSKDDYYNSKKGKSGLTDKEFDTLEEFIKKRDKNWIGLSPGYGIKNRKIKKTLPVPIFSLDKVDETTVDKWLEKIGKKQIVVSDKLDGSSLELVYKDSKPVELYTRGNGKQGGDISFLIPHLRIPTRVKKDCIVRAEALFSEGSFKKYKAEFDAARNAASGILNRQDLHPGLKDLDLVALKVLVPNVAPSKGLQWLKSQGFKTVAFKSINSSKLSSELLSALLKKRKTVSKFDLDGLVLEFDEVNRNPIDGNPKFAVKFKENLSADTAPVALVKQLHWDVSSHGYLVPRVEIEPLDFGGATVRFASGYNARFVIDNKIEKGAKVALVRSGDIIPKILKVIKPSKVKVVAPKTFGDYAFDKNKVNFILLNPKENSTVRIKRLERFFSTLEVDFIKIGLVTKLYEAGFTNLSKILQAKETDFVEVEGIQKGLASKIHQSIHSKIDNGVPLAKLMDASSMFPRGVGETRLTAIDKSLGLEKVAKLDSEVAVEKIEKIPGFSSITAKQIVKGLPLFYKWLAIVKIPIKKQSYVSKKGRLSGLNFSFTGYRSKDEEAIISENGGNVIPFGSKTNYLLIKDGGKASSKTDYAKERGIKVIDWSILSKKLK